MNDNDSHVETTAKVVPDSEIGAASSKITSTKKAKLYHILAPHIHKQPAAAHSCMCVCVRGCKVCVCVSE